jgi:hypothetical protein
VKSNADEKVLKLVDMTYEVALDETKWSSFLEAFASAVGGSSIFMRSNDMLAKAASFNSSIGYDNSVATILLREQVRQHST